MPPRRNNRRAERVAAATRNAPVQTAPAARRLVERHLHAVEDSIERVTEMGPRLKAFLERARDAGVANAAVDVDAAYEDVAADTRVDKPLLGFVEDDVHCDTGPDCYHECWDLTFVQHLRHELVDQSDLCNTLLVALAHLVEACLDSERARPLYRDAVALLDDVRNVIDVYIGVSERAVASVRSAIKRAPNAAPCRMCTDAECLAYRARVVGEMAAAGSDEAAPAPAPAGPATVAGSLADLASDGHESAEL